VLAKVRFSGAIEAGPGEVPRGMLL